MTTLRLISDNHLPSHNHLVANHTKLVARNNYLLNPGVFIA